MVSNMYCSVARLIIFLLICVLAIKCISRIQPQIGVYPGFLNIYSTGENFVNSGNLIAGQPYTLDIRMSDTNRYDYLLQFCTYNNKYQFVDQNSCLVCDKFFKQMWENDMYRFQGVAKRTIIHFKPPEPLARIECSMRIVQCCGCAKRACERNILPKLFAYPQQVINLAIVNEQTVGISATSVVSWPWWIWLLILLALILFLCLLPLLLLLYSQLCMHKRKVSDSKSQVLRPTPTKVSNILVRAKEVEVNGTQNENLSKQSVLPSLSARIFRTSSDSSSESAHSTASKSRTATVIKQQQSHTSWIERIIQSEIESKPMSDRHMGTCHLKKLIEECKNVDDYQDDAGSTSKFRSSTGECYINETDPEKVAHRANNEISRIIHQQTTYEEKFFKKNDCQKGIFEEGYDRVQFTNIVPTRHF